MTHKASTLDAGWLAATVAAIPPTVLADGNVRTGPVRLAFSDKSLAEPVAMDSKKPEDKKYAATLLFPQGADFGLYHQLAVAQLQKKFPNFDQPGSPINSATIDWPWSDQIAKQHLEPFQPGCVMMPVRANEDRPPFFTELRAGVLVPVPQQSVRAKFYSGAWCLALLNPYAWIYENMKRGVSFGLSGLIWIADDTACSGGGVDPVAAAAGLGGLTPPPGSLSGYAGVDPTQMFSQAATPGLPAAPGLGTPLPLPAAPSAVPPAVPGFAATTSPISPAGPPGWTQVNGQWVQTG